MVNPEVEGLPTYSAKDYKGPVNPDWCPGCGDFGVLRSLQQAAAELGIAPHEMITVSGIGCSSNLPGFFNAYGMHTLHGRAVAVASGVQLANHELHVIVTGGDGDCYGIGGNHFLHAMRRNINLLIIIMDNQIYGLTTGQLSPTSIQGMKTKSSPHGSIEAPINPIALAITGGATWIARGFSGEAKHLTELIKAGIAHKGFALLDVLSPCVTYNNTYSWFKERVRKLEETDHDPSGWKAALEEAFKWGEEIPIGLFFENAEKPALHELEPILYEGGPLAFRPLEISPDVGQTLVEELM